MGDLVETSEAEEVKFNWNSLFPELVSSDGTSKDPQCLAEHIVVGALSVRHNELNFLTKLKTIYREIRESLGWQSLEIVMVFEVHEPEDEQAFKASHAEMPWLAVPLTCKDERKSFRDRFQHPGPMFLVLFNQDGEELGGASECTDRVMMWGSSGYPYSKQAIEDLQAPLAVRLFGENLAALGENAYLADGTTIPVSDLAKADVVALILKRYDGYDSDELRVAQIFNEVQNSGVSFQAICVPWWGDPNFVQLDVDESKPMAKEKAAMRTTPHIPPEVITAELRADFQKVLGSDYPSMILILEKGGKVINPLACMFITRSGKNSFPWTQEALVQYEVARAAHLEQQRMKLGDFQLFDTALIRGTESVDIAYLRTKERVGFFLGNKFGDGMLAPLRAVYHQLQAAAKSFEVVYLSTSETQAQFDAYYADMPWLAVRYDQRSLVDDFRAILQLDTYDFNGILLMFDNAGNFVEAETQLGVGAAGAQFFPWGPKEMQAYEASEGEQKWLERERQSIEEQEARGNGVLRRLRGPPRHAPLPTDHILAFAGIEYVTFGAPTCIRSTGRVRYEVEVVELKDVGACLVGWADTSLSETLSRNSDGVGDVKNSYAIDGFRRCKMQDGKSSDFGTKWKGGDVVGCAVDFEARSISFGLNGNWGQPLGIAFLNVEWIGGLYPCVCSYSGAVLILNLGSRAFRFGAPGDGYEPVVPLKL